jgi:MFS family permease
MGKFHMNLGFLTKDVKIQSRKLFAVTTLASGSLAWVYLIYFSFDSTFKSITTDLFWVYVAKTLFLSFGALSAIFGSVISGKVDRRRLLWLSTTLGVVATAALAVFPGTIFSMLIFALIGISLGLVILVSWAFLADCTVVEERARVSGLIFLETFVMVIFSLALVEIFSLGLIGVVLLGILLKSTSYIALFLDPCDRESGKEKSWRAILAHRDFTFYLFPWLMFNIASGLTSFVWTGLPPEPGYEWAQTVGNPLHILGAGVFGFMGGFMADRLGRKLPIIIGMVMLGVSFAWLGIATSPLSVLVYLTLSGIAWGFLMVVYLSIPGDLAIHGSKEKFYALGIVIPIIIYMGIPAVSEFLNIGLPANALSSVLSIILFLSVIPIFRAKETLPEHKMRAREISEYLDDKARKFGKNSKRT